MALYVAGAAPAYVASAYAVTVTSPNGGETLSAGSTHTIQWTAPPEALSFKLKFSMDNGTSWNTIGSGITGTSHDWTVPTPTKTKQKCLAKVIGFNFKGVKVGADVSAGTFTILDEVDSLEGVVSLLQSRMDSQEADLSSLQGTVSSLQGSLSSLQTTVSLLETKTEELEFRVNSLLVDPAVDHFNGDWEIHHTRYGIEHHTFSVSGPDRILNCCCEISFVFDNVAVTEWGNTQPIPVVNYYDVELHVELFNLNHVNFEVIFRSGGERIWYFPIEGHGVEWRDFIFDPTSDFYFNYQEGVWDFPVPLIDWVGGTIRPAPDDRLVIQQTRQ